MAYNKLTIKERLILRSTKVGDCIIWTGAKYCNGYGMIRINGKWHRVHRVAFEQSHGAINKSLVVMHSCDNPPCINPLHLSANTQAANIADMNNKGRANRRTHDLHPKAKLNSSTVKTIRSRYIKASKKDGASALAREFGVSKQAVLAVLHGKTWKENK